MSCFDRLPRGVRDQLNTLRINLHDDHILGGRHEVERALRAVATGDTYEKPGNGQN